MSHFDEIKCYENLPQLVAPVGTAVNNFRIKLQTFFSHKNVTKTLQSFEVSDRSILHVGS